MGTIIDYIRRQSRFAASGYSLYNRILSAKTLYGAESLFASRHATHRHRCNRTEKRAHRAIVQRRRQATEGM